MAKKQWTEAEKKAQAEKAAKAREFLKTDDVLVLVDQFGPRVKALSQGLVLLVSETGELVAEICAALGFIGDDSKEKYLPTGDTKKTVLSVFKACGADSQLMRYATEWTAVILGREHDATIGAESGDDYEGEGIKSWRELREAAKKGNEKLGIKQRGKRAKANVTPISAANGAPDLWGPLAEVLKTQAGQAMCRQVLNKAGFEMSVLKTSVEPMPDATKTSPQSDAGDRKMSGADSQNLARTLKLDEQLKMQAHAAHVAKMKAKKARRAGKRLAANVAKGTQRKVA